MLSVIYPFPPRNTVVHMLSPTICHSERRIGWRPRSRRIKKAMMSLLREITISSLGQLRSHPLLNSFSITKWIHLNGGDSALRMFFKKAFSVLNSGGTFVLEPQTWDSYAKSKRMDEVCDGNFYIKAY
jgi:hypothetical protein